MAEATGKAVASKIVGLPVTRKPCHEHQQESGIKVALGFANYKLNATECSSPLPPNQAGPRKQTKVIYVDIYMGHFSGRCDRTRTAFDVQIWAHNIYIAHTVIANISMKQPVIITGVANEFVLPTSTLQCPSFVSCLKANQHHDLRQTRS